MKNNLKKISFNLIMVVIISIISGGLLFSFIYYNGKDYMDYYFLTSSYIYDHETPYIEKFQNFVDENNISMKDVERYGEWVNDNKITFFSISKDGIQIYNLLDTDFIIQQAKDMYDYRMAVAFRQNVHFSDGDADVFIYANFTEKYYTYLIIIDFIVSMGLCLFIIFWQVRRIIRRLQANLEEADRKEKNTRMDKDSLMRSMAHDLRTPLTGLMSYLDIVKEECISGDLKQEYLGIVSEKALEIKELTDQIFDFALASSEDTIELDEPMDAEYAIGDYLSEMCMELEEADMSVNIDNLLWKKAKVIVSGRFMGRIFSNLTSNIVKYADSSKPVYMETIYSKQNVAIQISNYVAEDKKLLSSAGIGLKNVEMMMQRMNGKFVYDSNDENGIFIVMLEFKIAE